MYVRKLRVALESSPSGKPVSRPCPLKYLDSFAMRSFTGESRFDDTLPLADGRMEAGRLVPLQPLRSAMEDWFRRKSWLAAGESLVIEETNP